MDHKNLYADSHDVFWLKYKEKPFSFEIVV